MSGARRIAAGSDLDGNDEGDYKVAPMCLSARTI